MLNFFRDLRRRTRRAQVECPSFTGVHIRFDADVTLKIPDVVFDRSCTLLKGPSGCGKSTALMLVAGFLEPSRGLVERPKARVAYVSQEFNLLAEASVLDNLLIAQSLAGMRVDRGAAEAMIGRVGLGHRVHAYAPKLSCGQRQRAAIARAMVVRAPLLLLDEPTSGLDDENAGLIVELIRDLTSTTRIIIATHDSHFDEIPHALVEYPARMEV